MANTEWTRDQIVVARPCAVTLNDGTVYERAYLDEMLHVPKENDRIDIQEVADITESPHRLPVELATKLYESGETGMGFQLFAIEFADMPAIDCVNNLYNSDFPDLPSGYNIRNVTDVRLLDRRTVGLEIRRNYDVPRITFRFHDETATTVKRLWNKVRQIVSS